MNLFLQQRQELKLYMTTQLRQSIELLQYSTYDLEQFIRQQELENPLIDLQEKPTSPQIEKLPPFRPSKYAKQATSDISKPIEENLRDYLLKMVNLNFKDRDTQKLLKYIINNLNDFGYLIIEDSNAIYSAEFITKGIELLQQIGPIGIGARNLKECLIMQCQYRYPNHLILQELIQNHLSLLAENKWQMIAKNMKCSVEVIQQLNKQIQTLNPRPCNFSVSDSIEYVQPDIIVEFQENELTFYLNDYYLPQIHLNKHYLNVPTINSEDKQYILNHHRNYQWLVNSIEQRRNTIIKIMHVLINKQLDFFKNGIAHLAPLTLKEVAEEIDMHESTVSRTTSNKFIQTPIGTFEMKSLFTSKISKNDGGQISQEKVKALLKQIIQRENKYKPYSDQKISEYLNSEYAIQIARRTISKYRDELQIPTASMRKIWK